MKVLQIVDGYEYKKTNSLNEYGGIAKFMLDMSNYFDKSIKTDFLTANNICPEFYNFNISRKKLKGKIIYNHRLYKFLKKNKYDIVHVNTGVFLFSFQVVIVAKLAGVKNVIVHSHSVPRMNTLRKILRKVLNPLYRKLTNKHLACSIEASKSLFTKTNDVVVIKNGIDINKFKFNSKIRDKYRKELKIENKIVYGHVGRFDKQKNHEFLIDLFDKLVLKQDAVLLLVGYGELEESIKEKVKELKLEDKVMFLGLRDDINNLLCAMDYFLFPSLYEGLGLALIEAQTSGLPVFVSNGVPEEANVSDHFYRIDSYDIDKWKNKILKTKIGNRNNYKSVIDAGYDIKDSAKQIEEIYKDMML